MTIRTASLSSRCALPHLAVGLVALLGAIQPAKADDPPPVPAASTLPSVEPIPAALYSHKAVVRREFGAGPKSYWLFEPAEPKPDRAPVVVFNHGWMAMNPGPYGAWIEHLVRSGKVVIFPRYQTDCFTNPADFLPNAMAAVLDALDVLQTSPHHVRPDRQRFAMIGHSAGGNLAAQMAAVASDFELPPIRALVLLMPGEVRPIREPGLSRIPASTLLVVVAAEQDRVVGDMRARQIFASISAIPPSRKKFVFYRTDRHGWPNLVADHLAPTAALAEFDTGEGPFRSLQMSEGEVNTFDRHGFWRLADVTLEAAFVGQTLDEATRGGQLFRDLGRWSDGQPVLAPIVSDDLTDVPRVFPANGLKLIPWQPAEQQAAVKGEGSLTR